MRFAILAATTFLTLVGFATPAKTYNPDHIRRLVDTNTCPGCDLQKADLSGTNLSHANLRGASLMGANLRRANLIGANLRRANLKNADLENADLTKTNSLIPAQVKAAKNWQKAKYDKNLRRQLGLPLSQL